MGGTGDKITYDLAGQDADEHRRTALSRTPPMTCSAVLPGTPTAGVGHQHEGGWRVTAYDAMGRALTVTTEASRRERHADGAERGHERLRRLREQLHLFGLDGRRRGREVALRRAGRRDQHWAMGYPPTTPRRATRTACDAQGQVTGESQPGNATAAGLPGVPSPPTASPAALLPRRVPMAAPRPRYDDEGNETPREQRHGTEAST